MPDSQPEAHSSADTSSCPSTTIPRIPSPTQSPCREASSTKLQAPGNLQAASCKKIRGQRSGRNPDPRLDYVLAVLAHPRNPDPRLTWVPRRPRTSVNVREADKHE